MLGPVTCGIVSKITTHARAECRFVALIVKSVLLWFRAARHPIIMIVWAAAGGLEQRVLIKTTLPLKSWPAIPC